MATDVLGLETGESLGRSLFRLGKELHRSGSGAVFEATVLRTGLPVAIKRKDSSELGDRKLIEHEALLLETLSHPNVAVCLGSFVEAGSLYMVLEIADKGDLGQLIQMRHRARQHLSEHEIWGLFTQVCAGVAYMHGQKIIHRDLKPRNVLLYAAPPPRSGRRGHGLRLVAKIADLGVSRQLGATAEMANTFYGTPLYISPELCRNEAYNAKTDVWSLGVMLYELAALRPPFFGYSILELAGSITRGTYDALPTSYSTTLQASVRMMLSLSPTQRPSVDQYCRWLGHKLKPNWPSAPEPENQPSSKSKPESQHNQFQDALTEADALGVDQHGAALAGSSPAAHIPHEPSLERHAHGHGGPTARTADAAGDSVGQVHHAWSARHRPAGGDPRLHLDAGGVLGGQESSSDCHESEFRQRKSDGAREQHTELAPRPSRGDESANDISAHEARHRWAEAQQHQQPEVPEPEPESEPAQLRSAASSQRVISARDRRLEERQISYGAQHESQILHVRAAAPPRQYPGQFGAHGPAPAASPSGAAISNQLSRLRKSMGTKRQAEELPHWNEPTSNQSDEFRDAPGTASSTERAGNGQSTSGVDWPPEPAHVQHQYVYNSSGGSSSGTDLVHRGYAASLGLPRGSEHHHVGAAVTSALVTARGRRGDEQSEVEIEVAGLASQRTGSYKWPCDRAEGDSHASQPRNERPSTASTLRSPYAWYAE